MKRKAKNEESAEKVEDIDVTSEVPSKKVKTDDASERAFIQRESTSIKSFSSGKSFVKCLSMNVAGLRSFVDNADKKSSVKMLMDKENPDIVCIQEV